MMSTYLRYSPPPDIKNHDHPTVICYLMESLLKFQIKLHLLFMSQVQSMSTEYVFPLQCKRISSFHLNRQILAQKDVE